MACHIFTTIIIFAYWGSKNEEEERRKAQERKSQISKLELSLSKRRKIERSVHIDLSMVDLENLIERKVIEILNDEERCAFIRKKHGKKNTSHSDEILNIVTEIPKSPGLQ